MQTRQTYSEDTVQASWFGPADNSEYFLMVHAPASGPFSEQVRALETAYQKALDRLQLPGDSAVYRRFFVSDAANQVQALRSSHLYASPNGPDAAVSVIQQPPLHDAKIVMFAYHIRSERPLQKVADSNQSLLVRREGVSQHWFTNLCDGLADGDSYGQTEQLFGELLQQLKAREATLESNTVRTWICVRDVDRNYQGMVDRRRELFQDNGLTRDTHYIASTGIEGSCSNINQLVSLDALSLIGLAPGQIRYLHAYDHLCNTIDYNVTFERATKVSYRDRAHIYISGTASIDHHGEVLYEGDVVRQMDRTLENVDVLLKDGGATLADMMYLFVYLRDISDAGVIEAYMRKLDLGIPYVLLHAPVCRPQWLVEVEGVAAVAEDNPELPSF